MDAFDFNTFVANNWIYGAIAVAIALFMMGLLDLFKRGKQTMTAVRMTKEQKREALAKYKAQKNAIRDTEKMMVADAIAEALDNLYHDHPEFTRKKYFTDRLAATMGLKDLLPKPESKWQKEPSSLWNKIPVWLRIERLQALKAKLEAQRGKIAGPRKPIPGKPGSTTRAKGKFAAIKTAA